MASLTEATTTLTTDTTALDATVAQARIEQASALFDTSLSALVAEQATAKKVLDGTTADQVADKEVLTDLEAALDAADAVDTTMPATADDIDASRVVLDQHTVALSDATEAVNASVKAKTDAEAKAETGTKASTSKASGKSSTPKATTKPKSTTKPKPKPTETADPKPKGIITWGKCDGETEEEYKDGKQTGNGRGCAIASQVRARIADNKGVDCSAYGSMHSTNADGLVKYANNILASGPAYFKVSQYNELQVNVKAYLCG